MNIIPGDIWAQSGGQGSFLAWVITTLGLLSRVYPAEVRLKYYNY